MDGYQAICEQLLGAAEARLVVLIDEGGGELARAGEAEGFDAKAVAASFTAMLAANAEHTSAFHEGDRISTSCSRRRG